MSVSPTSRKATSGRVVAPRFTAEVYCHFRSYPALVWRASVASLGERNVVTNDGRIVRSAAFGSPAGLPVVWHHGNPGSRISPVSEVVLRDPAVMLITYDRPGGGRSEPLPGRRVASCAPDVARIADAWGLDRFGTVGFSGGGSFALATAATLGDRLLAAVVLAGAAPIDAEDLDFRAGMADATAFYGDAELERRRGEILMELEPTRRAISSKPPCSATELHCRVARCRPRGCSHIRDRESNSGRYG